MMAYRRKQGYRIISKHTINSIFNKAMKDTAVIKARSTVRDRLSGYSKKARNERLKRFSEYGEQARSWRDLENDVAEGSPR